MPKRSYKPPSIFKQMADHMKRVAAQRKKDGLPPPNPFRMDVELEKAITKAKQMLGQKEE